MTDELYINGKDAYTYWRLGFEEGALANLMTPAPNKDYITNSSRLEHGTRYITSNSKTASRDVQIMFHITADSKSDLLAKFASFCEELKGGSLVIYDKKYTGNYYRCVYSSCTSYTQNLMGGICKFSLKVKEKDPTDRGAVSIHQ